MENVAVGDDQVNWIYERLRSLKYLQYVMNKTFPLDPAIGTIRHKALQDRTLPTREAFAKSRSHPVYVQQGNTVTISFHALHRRQDLFGGDVIMF